jgi:hypothetical protein
LTALRRKLSHTQPQGRRVAPVIASAVIEERTHTEDNIYVDLDNRTVYHRHRDGERVQAVAAEAGLLVLAR